jgi:hypothetical protein
MKTSQTWKLLFLFILIIAFIIIYYNDANNIRAAAYMGGILIVLWLSGVVSNITMKNRKNRIIRDNKKTRAKIVSKKVHNKNTVLQLQIILGGESYITSYVYRNASNIDGENYAEGQNIEVYINPENQHDIFIPEILKESTRRMRISWSTIFIITVSVTPILIPIVIAIFDTSGREFQDIEYFRAGEKQESIWELRFEGPSKIYIKIYDPTNKTKALSIKDKKPKELSSNTHFFIAQQKQNVVIVGDGETPVFDIYDPVTHKKISGIEEFEKNNEILSKGIVKIDSKTIRTKYLKDKVIEIVTNEGKGYYYNIDKNRFYNSEEEIEKEFKKEDLELLSQHMNTFALSSLRNSPIENHQLYLVEATSKKGIEDLLNFAGTDNLDLSYFEKSYYHRYKHCKLIPLVKDDFFISGKIIYYDFDLIVIQYLESASATAESIIKAYDNTGNTIFTINLSDYPNVGEIKTDKESYLKSYYCQNVIRDNDNLIFLFEEYGALCINLKTGNQVWKFEP